MNAFQFPSQKNVRNIDSKNHAYLFNKLRCCSFSSIVCLMLNFFKFNLFVPQGCSNDKCDIIKNFIIYLKYANEYKKQY
ncbi:hypothetical protein X975_20423, partial [Stegodyphus mimosarum]